MTAEWNGIGLIPSCLENFNRVWAHNSQKILFRPNTLPTERWQHVSDKPMASWSSGKCMSHCYKLCQRLLTAVAVIWMTPSMVLATTKYSEFPNKLNYVWSLIFVPSARGEKVRSTYSSVDLAADRWRSWFCVWHGIVMYSPIRNFLAAHAFACSAVDWREFGCFGVTTDSQDWTKKDMKKLCVNMQIEFHHVKCFPLSLPDVSRKCVMIARACVFHFIWFFFIRV